jgi:dTDP-4-amino-4,6-dideoxygalactose transaminase
MNDHLAILGDTPAFSEPIFVTRPPIPDPAQFQARLEQIFGSRCLTNNGPFVRELEARLQAWLETEFCVCFCNGTVALEIGLRALDLRGEVITTPFTFPATSHAIAWNGLTPVFCDVDPLTYNLDVRRATELVTERTAAILPVHVFGNPCDVEGLEKLASARGLRVIYDAAHAFGVRHRGRSLATWGDLTMLSFHATKLFHTAEGGALVGMRGTAVERLRLLRNFGIVNQNEVRGVGSNGKLSELHAAVGIGVLDLVADEIRRRGAIAARYHERLAGVDGLQFQKFAEDTQPNHGYFTVAVDAERFGLSRDELHRALLAENVVTRKYFHPLCSENECYRALPSARPSALPHAHALAARILCLPIYGSLPLESVDRIAERLLAIRAAADKVRRAVG